MRELSARIASTSLIAWLGTGAALPPAPAQQSRLGPGRSSSSDCFEGTGGPHGDFDWVVRAGDTFFFDTTETLIVGGPGGNPTTVQRAVGGVVDVRNLTIEAGGLVRVQGPNPMRILATGDVVIRGTLDLSGFPAPDVATLNTGNMIENGGAGAAGGGRGGIGNGNTTGSTPRGGRGQGPFGAPDDGGEGGESGYAPGNLGKNARRPGGGGGGRFARDVIGWTTSPPNCSLDAGAGTQGHPVGRGAESGVSPARGGTPGLGPFQDPSSENDFFGVRPVLRGGGLVELIRGELPVLWAGYGGGGGGNAIPATTFPNPNWTFASDEKGGGGGGGGGGLQVQALGRIVFGAAGDIRANGATGGTGENTSFLDHVGGTGGGSSGGHIVLESASQIDFTDGGASSDLFPREWLSACGPLRRSGPTQFVDSGARGYSNGGAGGGGIIQLHVPDPLAPAGTDPVRSDIVLPTPVSLFRNPLDAIASPGALVLFPTFAQCPGLRPRWLPGGLRLPDIDLLDAGDRGNLLPEDPAVRERTALPPGAQLGALDLLRLPRRF